MNKSMRRMMTGLLAFTIISVSAVPAMANEIGAPGALSDDDVTLEEMLVYAMEDEYLAKTEYEKVMEAFGESRPFSKITEAEKVHIGLLESLFEKYNVAVPDKDWTSLIDVPATLEEAYATSVGAEKENIAMYEKFLKKDIPDDVRAVFERLLNASKNHLAAYERKVSVTTVSGPDISSRSGKGSKNGLGQRTGKGLGRGQRDGRRIAPEYYCLQ